MKNKINRKVYFEFNGFDGLENGETIINGKSVKLYSRNFDKILNLLISKIHSKGIDHSNGFVDIPSVALKSTLDNYKPYLEYLFLNGYLERSYFVYKIKGKPSPEYLFRDYTKSKPFGYRFTEHFKQWVTIKRVIFVPINDNKAIPTIAPVKTTKKNFTNKLFLNPEIVKRLKKDFKSCQILCTEIEKTNFQNSKFIDIGKWFYNQAELFKWDKGDQTFKFTGQRLYTNFTMLSSHVRLSNIQISDESLKCKDISNSFPLMLGIHCIKQNPNLANDRDFIEYCTWVTTGTFYENLTKRINEHRNSDEKNRLARNNKKKHSANNSSEIAAVKSKRLFTKDIVKLLYQIYLNGSVDGTPYVPGYSNSLIVDYMKLKFPCIHDQIMRIKEREQCVYDVLVKIESNFIFRVVGELYKKYDSIKLLTVHDSIYTTVSDFDKLDAEWNVQLQNLFDLLPSTESIHEKLNIDTINIMQKELDMEIEEIEELDYEDPPVSLINDRCRYLLDEFDDFSEEKDDDFYMKL
jgi:hypothetical protein